jgi:hypothetical protein
VPSRRSGRRPAPERPCKPPAATIAAAKRQLRTAAPAPLCCLPHVRAPTACAPCIRQTRRGLRCNAEPTSHKKLARFPRTLGSIMARCVLREGEQTGVSMPALDAIIMVASHGRIQWSPVRRSY